MRANLRSSVCSTNCGRGERFLSSKTAHKSTSEQAGRERGHCASVRQLRRHWPLQTLIFRTFGHSKPEYSRLSGQPTMDYFRFGQPTFRIIFVRRRCGSTEYVRITSHEVKGISCATTPSEGQAASVTNISVVCRIPLGISYLSLSFDAIYIHVRCLLEVTNPKHHAYEPNLSCCLRACIYIYIFLRRLRLLIARAQVFI